MKAMACQTQVGSQAGCLTFLGPRAEGGPGKQEGARGFQGSQLCPLRSPEGLGQRPFLRPLEQPQHTAIPSAVRQIAASGSLSMECAMSDVLEH